MVSAKLRGQDGVFEHWCPGCEETHIIWTEREKRPRWEFDGNIEAPTFSPSVKIEYDGPDAGQVDGDGFRAPPACCHYFIRAGRIEFCSDSTHAFSGQTVPLPDIPEGA